VPPRERAAPCTKIRQEYGRRSESEVVGDEASWKYRAAA
jgi:hypothetical protein